MGEKRCPICGSKMIRIHYFEDGEFVNRWICSAGILCQPREDD